MNIYSFSHKILLGIFVSIAIPLVGLWLANTYYSEEVDNKIQSDLNAKAELLGERINNWIDMNLRVLNQNANLAL